MVTDVKYIWKGMTYFQMKSVIESNRRLRSFPVVLDQGENFMRSMCTRNSSCRGPYGAVHSVAQRFALGWN